MVANIFEVEGPRPSFCATLAKLSEIALLAVILNMASLVSWLYPCATIAAVDGVMEVYGLILCDLMLAEVAA